jgi:hypothetical protein
MARPDELRGKFDLEATVDHLESCTECAALVRSRRQFDLMIADTMRSMPVPESLREQLLTILALHEAQRPMASVTRIVPTNQLAASGFSPRVLRWIAIAACLFVASAMLFGLHLARSLPQFPLDSVHPHFAALIGHNGQNLVPFNKFEDGQTARLPQSHLRTDLLQGPRLFVLHSTEDVWIRRRTRHAAVYFFELTGRARPIPGVLVVLTRDGIDSASQPRESSFLESGAKPVTGGVVSTWTEGSLTYLCYVQGTERELSLLWQPTRTL